MEFLYKTDPTKGLCKLVTDANAIKVVDEEGNVKWQKAFDSEIDEIELTKGNFSTIYPYFTIYLKNNSIIKYSTLGNLISVVEADTKLEKFEGLYEEFLMDTQFFKDSGEGQFNVQLSTDAIEEYELFNQRGERIYKGSGNEIQVQIEVLKYEILQIKARIDMKVKIINIKLVEPKRKILCLGDSTLANSYKLPTYGWGQTIQELVSNPVINYAVSGRSTVSIVEEGHYRRMLSVVESGDIVIIGFGHNDEKINHFGAYPNKFLSNITAMSTELMSKDAHVFVCTPIARHNFIDEVLVDTHKDYSQVLRDSKLNVIDTDKHMQDLILDLGEDKSKKLFSHVAEIKMFDNTHLSSYGAECISKYVVKIIKEKLGE